VTEHLIPATDSDDPRVRVFECRGDAGSTEPGKVVDRCPTARDHDEVGVDDLGGFGGPPHDNVGLHGERIEVRGVREVGETDHGDAHGQGRLHRPGRGNADIERVLDTEHRHIS